ncbi:MAG: hypothetical protein D6726_02545, partial [Nitrospirae bacterium]
MGKKVLIEASKIISGDRDGCERYTVELLRGLLDLPNNCLNTLDLFVYVGGYILPLDAIEEVITLREIPQPDSENEETEVYLQAESKLLRLRNRVAGVLNRTLPVPVARKLYEMEMAVRDGISWLKKRGDAFRDFDLIHLTLPQNYRPFVKTRTRTVTTVHDLTHLYFPGFHTRDNVDLSSKSMKHLVRKGGYFIAVSESTKRDLVKDYSVKEDRITVIYEACDQERFRRVDDPSELLKMRKKYGIPDLPYILTLNTLE